MAELGQEEKDKLWSELKDQWKIQKGDDEKASRKAEKRINQIQELLGVDVTDFDERKPDNGAKEYTDEEALKLFTEEELEIMDTGVDKAIAIKHVLSIKIVEKYPKLKGNAPGIGQIVNVTYDLIKEKLKI
jgi:hydroxymethylpyrimidine pyrophosphatase-like HAD family hydrolase